MYLEPEVDLRCFQVSSTENTLGVFFQTINGHVEEFVMDKQQANNLACTILNAIGRWKE